MEFRHRLLDARAAGLVYTTLLSLVPFLAVMFSVLKAFGVHQQIEPVLAQALEPLGSKGQDITDTIIGFVDNLKIGVLGVVGVAGLFYTTFSLIDKIEQALNAIWLVREGRPWGRKFADYLSAVLVGPLLVVTAFGLLASIQSNTLVQRVLEIQPFGLPDALGRPIAAVRHPQRTVHLLLQIHPSHTRCDSTLRWSAGSPRPSSGASRGRRLRHLWPSLPSTAPSIPALPS